MMRRFYLPSIILISLLVVFLSCSNKPKRSRKPVSSINIEPSKRNYYAGDSIKINITTKIKDGELESVKLYLNNSLLTEKKELKFDFSVKNLTPVGQHIFKTVTKKTDGLENIRTLPLMVLSDIIPPVKGYRILKEYPHSTKFFTQGLEYHDGFLYEGTGENGSSGLYKINPFTGNPVKSVMLDEKYFGEGITILNNKIYQLTYKDKVGFIYRLSDFALIDSFKFASPEGWGLTNDGKNLIMSNGTNLLSWIDTENFNVVKTLQVADNKTIINNLNELEYFDGKILANLWTTNTLAEIDTETGKILSYIDLNGILSVMYQDQDERIDVMNGIAYDHSTGKLFVTGKLWPKLYEIEIIPSE